MERNNRPMKGTNIIRAIFTKDLMQYNKEKVKKYGLSGITGKNILVSMRYIITNKCDNIDGRKL